MVSADVESRYKTKDELEREDHIKYKKHQEMTFLRRQAKIDAEGFKCPYEGCTERFPTRYELGPHLQVHRDECFKQMKCCKPDCGKKVGCDYVLQCILVNIMDCILEMSKS